MSSFYFKIVVLIQSLIPVTMKTNTNFLRQACLLFSLLLVAAFSSPLAAQNKASAAESVIIDNGLYTYEVTGDAVKDAENQRIAKEKFVAEHPERYEQVKAALVNSEKHAIDYKEYLQMPAGRKAHIDANPEIFYFINK